jgi:hypothetical protein
VVLLALCASAFAACRSGNDDVPVRVIDLLREVDRAEKRPSGGTFEISEHTLGSVGATSLSVPAPSRIIWTLRFPRRATFRAQVAAPALPPGGIVTFRVGVSDDRIYERLAQAAVTGAAAAEWTALTADLSAYAGWKWSLFYRPETHPWRLVLSADTNGVTARALWASPGIDTDRARARDFARRKQE